jgi:hypothetical protein
MYDCSCYPLFDEAKLAYMYARVKANLEDIRTNFPEREKCENDVHNLVAIAVVARSNNSQLLHTPTD